MAKDPISIHAPLAGRDAALPSRSGGRGHFNPRAPCGARRERGEGALLRVRISIHAPLAGRDG